MKYVVVSGEGILLPIATKLASEGHDVTLVTKQPIGQGMVKTIPYKPNVLPILKAHPSDFILFDSPKHASCIGQLTAKCLLISLFSEALSKPAYTRNIIKAFDLPQVTHARSRAFTVEGLYNGNTFLTQSVTLPYTRFMNGDIGPDVGYTGAVTYNKLSKHDKLYNETLGKIEKPLRKTGHRGFVSLECSIEEGALNCSSIHAGVSIVTLPTFFAGTLVSMTDLVTALCNGGTVSMKQDTYSISVGMSVPPWPFTLTDPQAQDIKGLCAQHEPHTWFTDLMHKDGYFCPNTSGFVGAVTARGRTIRECSRRVYRSIDNITINNCQYRTDIGSHAESFFGMLKRLEFMV